MLYGDATLEDAQQLQGFYVGPRREMITPWSTNAGSLGLTVSGAMVRVALVGYTNVGKSTLMNLISKRSPPVLSLR